jgi:hypothetical protein
MYIDEMTILRISVFSRLICSVNSIKFSTRCSVKNSTIFLSQNKNSYNLTVAKICCIEFMALTTRVAQ